MLFSRVPKINRPLKDANQEHAAQLLLTPTALVDLSASDARVVAGFMQHKRFKTGTVFIKEGEVMHTDFMMLILEGDVLIQNEVASVGDSMVMSIIGPGNMIGEMGVLDGAPRCATCSAATELTVALLSRKALRDIINDNAPVAARLMLAISKRLSDKLREANRRIKTFSSLSRALQQELDVADRMHGRA